MPAGRVLPIGFFMPLAFPAMATYMWYQSAMIGEGFYMTGHYAKRKIDSMSNEQFNKLTAADIARIASDDMKSFIDALPHMFQQGRQVNKMILQELVNLLEDTLNFGIDTFISGGKSISARIEDAAQDAGLDTGLTLPNLIQEAHADTGTTVDYPDAPTSSFEDAYQTSLAYVKEQTNIGALKTLKGKVGRNDSLPYSAWPTKLSAKLYEDIKRRIKELEYTRLTTNKKTIADMIKSVHNDVKSKHETKEHPDMTKFKAAMVPLTYDVTRYKLAHDEALKKMQRYSGNKAYESQYKKIKTSYDYAKKKYYNYLRIAMNNNATKAVAANLYKKRF